MEPLERIIGGCFYLAIPLTGSEKEIQEWLNTASFIERIVDQLFTSDGLSIMDIHDQIQSHTALDADAYVDEIVSNLEEVEEEECLILIP
jgi:hypothetical protein